METLEKENLNKIEIGKKESGYTIRAWVKGRKYSLSLGNKKLPEETLIFNLPAVVTCPFKTSFCGGGIDDKKPACYALKAERLYKNTKEARLNNHERAKSFFFVSDMVKIIKSISEKKKIKHVRIHESGDFWGQDYFNKWQCIAKAFPDIVFYAYTKSFFLDFSSKGENFILIASFDKTTPERHKELFKQKESFFNKSFSIVDKGEKASCIQDCTKCNLCFSFSGLKVLTVEKH